jgi:hypothetical protein
MTRSSIDGAWARSRCPTLAVVFIALVAILPYGNALSADFTFDDVDVVRDNPAVQIYPAHRLLNYVHQTGSLYRPLTMLTYAANACISRDPFGYHVVNVLLHALVAIAVFCLGLRILHSRVAAVAAALLFAAHPIHTEAVTNIVGRAELLAALGVLLALLAFARARESAGRRRVVWSAVSVAAFAAALLAKESAFTGLGLLVVFHWWIDRRVNLRQRLAALMPYAAVGIGYLLLRFAVVGALGLPEAPGSLDNPLAHVDLWSRLRTAVIVLWEYVGLLALPLHLSADYSFDQIPVAHSWLDPRFLIAAALLCGLAGVLVAAMRRAPVLAVAALFTLVPLALTANLLFPIGTIKPSASSTCPRSDGSSRADGSPLVRQRRSGRAGSLRSRCSPLPMADGHGSAIWTGATMGRCSPRRCSTRPTVPRHTSMPGSCWRNPTSSTRR